MLEFVGAVKRWYSAGACYLTRGQPVLLAFLRIWFGYGFFKAGLGKLQNIETTASYFGDLGIPLPTLNAWIAGTTECAGGVLLFFGAGSRLVAIPLIVTMLVAYSTQHVDEFRTLWTIKSGAGYNPAPFFKAAPFLYLLTSLVVLFFGPGAISIDVGVNWYLDRSRNERSQNKPA
jgi:putative oxidoreductase